jgi:tetratricopeptide (TPR) repeat protein
MIVYNEFFEAYQLLDQIYTSVDEIIINLTGEEDRFRFTAKAFNAVIDNIPFKNDFSEIRNQMLEKSFGDWILYADPDEAYHPDFLANLQKFVDVACDAYLFTVENLHKNKPSNFTDTIRLFRRKPDMIFRGQVHENLDISLKGNDKKICQMPFNVIHFGYALPWKSEEASELAYSALCKKAVKKHPHDPMANFNFALCLLSVGKPIEAKDYLARAASIDPQYFHPRVQLGLLALKEALFHFGEVNTILPDSHRLKDVVRRVLSTVRPFVENE